MRLTRLRISTAILRTMQQHAQHEFPRECCGFLAGVTDGPTGLARVYLPLVNELASATAFRTEPRSVLAAFRRLRAEQLNLVAIVHSHPSSGGEPSATDRRENTYGESIPWLILDQNGQPWAWNLHQHDYSPVELIIDSEERLTDG